MYIKTTTNSAGQSYYHLVESYRHNGKVKQRTLLSLGKVQDNRLDELVTALSRHKEILTVLEAAQSVSVKDTFIYGPLLILERLFEKLGISEVLEEIIGCHPKLKFDFKKLIFTMVACRFVQPGSKLKIFEYWLKKLYPESIETKVGLHQLYRSLDLLCEHKELIETRLFWQGRDLLNLEVDVVLYDLTTLRFESTREDLGKLRRFGYSKEKRSDLTQVVLGLLVTPEGIPLGFEVYPGNTFEGKSLQDIVNKVRNKFRARRFIFVADRGLFSSKNLKELRQQDGEFVVGMKLGAFPKRREDFYDINKFQWLNDQLAIYETEHKGDRCIITYSKDRAKRDAKTREDILAKLNKKLAGKKLKPKHFISNKNYQKYLSGLDRGKPQLDEAAIAKAKLKDGFFGVVTNVADMSGQEIIQSYKQLWIIEDAFGEIKGSLKTRPVFHWTDKRIIGHLTLCFLAYLCEATLTKTLREKKLMLDSPAIDQAIIKPRALTVMEAMKELREVRAIPIKIKSQQVWVRTDIQGNAAKLYKAAGVKIPPKLLKLDPPPQKCSGTNP